MIVNTDMLHLERVCLYIDSCIGDTLWLGIITFIAQSIAVATVHRAAAVVVMMLLLTTSSTTTRRRRGIRRR